MALSVADNFFGMDARSCEVISSTVSWHSDCLRAARPRVGVRVPVRSRIFTSSYCPDRFCGQPNLLSNRYRGSYPWSKAAGAWSWLLTSNCCRGQENVDLYFYSPIRPHGVVLSYLSTETASRARGSVVIKALCYKPEGLGFETRWGEFLNLPNRSGRSRTWGLL
jgi:hypothetical protein